jgi:hypothetical protein
MSFSYPPLSEEEAQHERQTLLEEGTYSFKVNKAVSKMSRPKPGKESNPMIELHITLWDEKGRERYVYDYLVGTKSMAWKVRHFCDSTGLTKPYEEGKFDSWMAEGKSGIAIVGQQKGQPREGGGNYPDKNIIQDYVMTLKGATKVESKMEENGFNDEDIPF